MEQVRVLREGDNKAGTRWKIFLPVEMVVAFDKYDRQTSYYLGLACWIYYQIWQWTVWKILQSIQKNFIIQLSMEKRKLIINTVNKYHVDSIFSRFYYWWTCCKEYVNEIGTKHRKEDKTLGYRRFQSLLKLLSSH